MARPRLIVTGAGGAMAIKPLQEVYDVVRIEGVHARGASNAKCGARRRGGGDHRPRGVRPGAFPDRPAGPEAGGGDRHGRRWRRPRGGQGAGRGRDQWRGHQRRRRGRPGPGPVRGTPPRDHRRRSPRAREQMAGAAPALPAFAFGREGRHRRPWPYRDRLSRRRLEPLGCEIAWWGRAPETRERLGGAMPRPCCSCAHVGERA